MIYLGVQKIREKSTFKFENIAFRFFPSLTITNVKLIPFHPLENDSCK
jgi:hypothetical protein